MRPLLGLPGPLAWPEAMRCVGVMAPVPDPTPSERRDSGAEPASTS